MLYYRIVIVIFQTSCSADEWIFHKFDNVLVVNSIYMQWNIMTDLKKNTDPEKATKIYIANNCEVALD